jgi:hypothetical protein
MKNKELIYRIQVGGGVDRKRSTMYFECRHIKTNGSRCKSPALQGEPYCYFHARLHRPENATAPADWTLNLPLLEDRTSIQLALSRVLSALGSSKLDTRSAGLFLYGLQIASQNVERQGSILPYDSVESTTQAENGDELAPEKRVCGSTDRCFDCPESDTCENFDPKDVDDDEEDEEE